MAAARASPTDNTSLILLLFAVVIVYFVMVARAM